MYEYLDHTADVKVLVRASSLEELFSEAIRATMDYVYELSKVECSEEREYESDAADIGELLADTITRILGELDAGFAFGDVKDIKIEYDGSRRISIRYCGEKYEKNKHGFKTLVKAFTYNDLRICLEGYERAAEFVLDI